ncbi:hypothetical protein D3C76_1865620 [compost metagenome]
MSREPVIRVVTMVITISRVNSCGLIRPMSRPIFSTTSSIRPRVFISTPMLSAVRQG